MHYSCCFVHPLPCFSTPHQQSAVDPCFAFLHHLTPTLPIPPSSTFPICRARLTARPFAFSFGTARALLLTHHHFSRRTCCYAPITSFPPPVPTTLRMIHFLRTINLLPFLHPPTKPYLATALLAGHTPSKHVATSASPVSRLHCPFSFFNNFHTTFICFPGTHPSNPPDFWLHKTALASSSNAFQLMSVPRHSTRLKHHAHNNRRLPPSRYASFLTLFSLAFS